MPPDRTDPTAPIAPPSRARGPAEAYDATEPDPIAGSGSPLRPPVPAKIIPEVGPSLAISDFGALLPSARTGIALALAFAGLRPNSTAWLGGERLEKLAKAASMTPEALARLMDTPPSPPSGLAENGPWAARRIPLLAGGAVHWLDLFWRQDRGRRDRGSFAARANLPGLGRFEVRGRIEESRLDAVLDMDPPLPRAVGADASEAFAEAVRYLGMEGVLTVPGHRGTSET